MTMILMTVMILMTMMTVAVYSHYRRHNLVHSFRSPQSRESGRRAQPLLWVVIIVQMLTLFFDHLRFNKIVSLHWSGSSWSWTRTTTCRCTGARPPCCDTRVGSRRSPPASSPSPHYHHRHQFSLTPPPPVHIPVLFGSIFTGFVIVWQSVKSTKKCLHGQNPCLGNAGIFPSIFTGTLPLGKSDHISQ